MRFAFDPVANAFDRNTVMINPCTPYAHALRTHAQLQGGSRCTAGLLAVLCMHLSPGSSGLSRHELIAASQSRLSSVATGTPPPDHSLHFMRTEMEALVLRLAAALPDPKLQLIFQVSWAVAGVERVRGREGP